MKWKQFFTPVKSFGSTEAQEFIASKPPEEITILDVRQPGEYEAGHIPGARLIPLPELGNRFSEIDTDKPTVVYCAIGGRSRVAAQLLQGKGFKDIYNLSGGMKAWDGLAASGPVDHGLSMFEGKLVPEQSLIVAYSLEQGLKDFYLSILPEVDNEDAKDLFRKLAKIETSHSNRVFQDYLHITNSSISREEFEKEILTGVLEGGLTTKEYMELFMANMGSLSELIGIAMSIEAQAFDLYQRAAELAEEPQTKESLMKIAWEERTHLRELGDLMDRT